MIHANENGKVSRKPRLIGNWGWKKGMSLADLLATMGVDIDASLGGGDSAD